MFVYNLISKIGACLEQDPYSPNNISLARKWIEEGSTHQRRFGAAKLAQYLTSTKTAIRDSKHYLSSSILYGSEKEKLGYLLSLNLATQNKRFDSSYLPQELIEHLEELVNQPNNQEIRNFAKGVLVNLGIYGYPKDYKTHIVSKIDSPNSVISGNTLLRFALKTINSHQNSLRDNKSAILQKFSDKLVDITTNPKSINYEELNFNLIEFRESKLFSRGFCDKIYKIAQNCLNDNHSLVVKDLNSVAEELFIVISKFIQNLSQFEKEIIQHKDKEYLHSIAELFIIFHVIDSSDSILEISKRVDFHLKEIGLKVEIAQLKKIMHGLIDAGFIEQLPNYTIQIKE